MSPSDPAGQEASPTPEEVEARRRRRAEVFGEVLPESTRDDRTPDPGDAETAGDEWLRRNVPPHHG